MKKIPTIYQRDPATKLRHVMNEPHPDCGWVFAGEGAPTYKWDGTAIRVDDHNAIWQRREVKADKDAPHTFVQEGDPDPNTGKRVGWVLADLEGDPSSKWLAEAAEATPDLPAGTYELVGPKVQKNPHGIESHRLIRHGYVESGMQQALDLMADPADFDDLGGWLQDMADSDSGFEGVVWHHIDGRMAKIKVRDFPTPTES